MTTVAGNYGIAYANLSDGEAVSSAYTDGDTYGNFALWTWTAPTTDDYTVHTAYSSVYATGIFVWDGAAPADDPIAFDLFGTFEDWNALGQPLNDFSVTTFAAVAGQTYTFGITDKDGPPGESGQVALAWQSHATSKSGWQTPPVAKMPNNLNGHQSRRFFFFLAQGAGTSASSTQTDLLADYNAEASGPSYFVATAPPSSNTIYTHVDELNEVSPGEWSGRSTATGWTWTFQNWETSFWESDLSWARFVEWDGTNEIDRLVAYSQLSMLSYSGPSGGQGFGHRLFRLGTPLAVNTAGDGTVQPANYNSTQIHDLISTGPESHLGTEETEISSGALTVASDGKLSITLMTSSIHTWVLPDVTPGWFGQTSHRAEAHLYVQRPNYRTFVYKSAAALAGQGVYKVRKLDGSWYTLGSGSQAKIRALDGSWYVENVSGAQAKVRLAAGSMGPGVDFGKE